MAWFSENFISNKVFVSIFSTTFFFRNILHSKEVSGYDQMYIACQVKYSLLLLLLLLLLSNINETEFSRQIFGKYSTIKFHEKSFQWEPSCFIPMDRRTDMTKLIVPFRNFANAPKYVKLFLCLIKLYILKKMRMWKGRSMLCYHLLWIEINGQL